MYGYHTFAKKLPLGGADYLELELDFCNDPVGTLLSKRRLCAPESERAERVAAEMAS